MTQERNPLLEALVDPLSVAGFSIEEWNLLLQQGRRERFLARLHHLIDASEIGQRVPKRALQIMGAARAYVDFHQTQIGHEARTLARVLESVGTDLILLKGAAYLLADLPPTSGRHMSDLDVLVHREHLAQIESQLVSNGWESRTPDRYDQRYYREWMHEIPPLLDSRLGIEVDVHHALLPMTARVRPDSALLWQDSLPLRAKGFRVLAPVDMVLHSAAHLFYDGEIAGGLRDLLDIHQLLDLFGTEAGFWKELLERAAQLELGRPLFYATRYCRRLLGTAFPRDTLLALESRFGPNRITLGLMDLLVVRVLTPGLPDESGAPISSWLLYLRSHWLRMPPWLLVKHLSRKAWRRLKGRSAERA